MSRKEFGFLLQQYIEGKCTDEEKAFIEHWYGTLQNDERKPLVDKDLHALEPALWKQIQDRTQAPKAVPMPVDVPRRRWINSWIAVAASVLLMLTLGWWFYQQQTASYEDQQTVRLAGWTRHTNKTNIAEIVQLADGSQVRLTPQSTIQYPALFTASKREVFLLGEAFFSVQKMPTRPFYVYTGSVVTKVLGTSFLIRSQAANKQVVVEVTTGRVAVYKQTKGEEKTRSTNKIVLLTPNQKATYSTDKQQFVTGLVERPQLITVDTPASKTQSFAFDDVPLRQVINQLEDAYGIDIQLENDNQNACPLTADLSNLSLYAQLDMICAATKSNYTIAGTTIIISGKGCAKL